MSSIPDFDYLITNLMASRKSTAKELIDRIRRKSYELSKDKDDPGQLVLYSRVKVSAHIELSEEFKRFSKGSISISEDEDRIDGRIFDAISNFAERICILYPKIFWACYIYNKYQLEYVYKMVVNRIHINSHFFMNCVKRNYAYITDILKGDVFGTEESMNRYSIIKLLEYRDRNFFESLTKECLIECKQAIDEWLESESKFNPELYIQLAALYQKHGLDIDVIELIAENIEVEYNNYRCCIDDSAQPFIDKVTQHGELYHRQFSKDELGKELTKLLKDDATVCSMSSSPFAEDTPRCKSLYDFSMPPPSNLSTHEMKMLPWNLQNHYNDCCMFFLESTYNQLDKELVKLEGNVIYDPFKPENKKWENIEDRQQLMFEIGLMLASGQPGCHLAVKRVPSIVDWRVVTIDGQEVVTW